MDGYEYMAALMKALGHPTRLQILWVLRQGEACVCHLEATLGQRQAYISQHLMRLREDGLVIDRREGMNVFYALADEAVARMLDAAQETASRLAQTRDRHLRFAPPAPGIAAACTCPNCQPKAVPARFARGA